MPNNIFNDLYNQNQLAGQNALYVKPNPSERLINIVDDSGKGVGSVPESRLNEYIKQGYHIESAAQKKINDFIEDNSGIAGAFKTAAAYAGNELTFGLGKEIYKATQSDAEAQDIENKYKALGEANPYAAGAGAVAGFGGSMFLGGPVFKGAAKLGQLAEGAVTAGRAAETLGLGTRLGAKALGGAVENAAAGALLSAPTVINEVRQGNPQEAAEAVLINAGLGSLFGSALGAAGVGAKSALAKITGSDTLGKFSTDQTIRSMIHSTDKTAIKMIDALESKGVPRAEVADYIKKNNLFRNISGSFDEDVIPKLEELKSIVGKQIGAKHDQLLVDGVDGPSMAELFAKIQDDVVLPLMENGATRGKARQLATQLKDYAEALVDSQEQRALKEGLTLTKEELFQRPLSLSTLNNERKALDAAVYQNRQAAKLGDLNAMEQELSNVRKIYADTVNTYGEKALGNKWKSELAGLNKEYSIISTLSDVAERSAQVEKANQQFALKDLILGAGMLSHPAGILGSAATGIATKVLRKKGNQWLAQATDQTNNALINAANRVVDEKLSVIPKILNNTVTGPGIQAGTNSMIRVLDNLGIEHDNKEVSAFNTFADLLSQQVKAPQNIMTAAAKAIGPTDPDMSINLNNTSNNVINYLYNKMPKSPTGPVPFTAAWQPTPTQLKAFASTVSVAENPFVVLDKLQDGSLNQNHVQTLKALYPSIYSKLVDQIKMEGMKKDAKKLPYNKKIQLSLLLGEPLDPSLNNIKSLQASYQQQEQQKSAGSKLENVPGSDFTEMQKVQNNLEA